MGIFYLGQPQNKLSLIYPVDANLVMLWLMLFSKNPNLSGFVQWISAIAGAVAVFGLGRTLGWGRAPSAFTSFAWLSLPEILLQSTTVQLDLMVAVLVTISVYLFVLGLDIKSNPEMLLSGIALGLSLGVKQIAFFALPGYVIFIILFIFNKQSAYKKWIVRWLLAFSISAFFLGSFIYFQNAINYQNPFGEKNTVSEQINESALIAFKANFLYNTIRYAYQSIDFTGIPPFLIDDLIELKTQVFKSILTLIGIDIQTSNGLKNPKYHFFFDTIPSIHEDTSWYGILGFLLILPISILQFIKGYKQKDPLRIGLFLISVIYSILIIIMRPGSTPNQGRYFLLPSRC